MNLRDSVAVLGFIAALVVAFILFPLLVALAVWWFLAPTTFWERLATLIVAGLAGVGTFIACFAVLVVIFGR